MPKKIKKAKRISEQVTFGDLGMSRDQLAWFGKTENDTQSIAVDYEIVSRRLTDEGSLEINLQRYVSGRKLAEEFTLTFFGDNINPADPPQDETDPETGEVTIPAGYIRLELPSLSDLLDEDVSRNNPKTLRELEAHYDTVWLDIVKRYLPQLKNAIDVEN